MNDYAFLLSEEVVKKSTMTFQFVFFNYSNIKSAWFSPSPVELIEAISIVGIVVFGLSFVVLKAAAEPPLFIYIVLSSALRVVNIGYKEFK